MIDFILDIPIVFIIAFLAIAAICVGALMRSKDEKKNDDIITSGDLREQMNRENEKDGKKGLKWMPEKNYEDVQEKRR